MSNIRITKQFSFETGHALYGYDGKCKNIHGHSYHLYVTVIGCPIVDEKNPKNGMVMDFGEISRIVKEEIVNDLDHCVVLNKSMPQKDFLEVEELYDRLFLAPYQPTCENMVIDFKDRLIPRMPMGVKLHSIRLFETAKSYAEWFAEDN